MSAVVPVQDNGCVCKISPGSGSAVTLAGVQKCAVTHLVTYSLNAFVCSAAKNSCHYEALRAQPEMRCSHK